MPNTAPDGPLTVFTDRFWDDREHWSPMGVGVVPFSQKPYFGPMPAPTVTPLIGTPDQWLRGFSYADWIAGRITPGLRCVTVPYKVQVARIREAQNVGPIIVPTHFVEQAQTIRLTPVSDVLIAQAQDTPYVGALSSLIRQAQTIRLTPVSDVLIAQAQDIPLVAIAPAVVEQAQDVAAGLSSSALVEQAQDVPYALPADALVEQAQDIDTATFVPPGATCGAAAAITLNVTYEGTTSGTNTDWFVISAFSPGTFELISGGGPASSPAFTVSWGTCALFLKVVTAGIPNDSFTFSAIGVGGIYVSIIGDGTNYSYTFRING